MIMKENKDGGWLDKMKKKREALKYHRRAIIQGIKAEIYGRGKVTHFYWHDYNLNTEQSNEH